MWNVSKALQIPIDSKIKHISDIPYTISFVIRKRQQIDNLSELPKDKKPPEDIIWDGTSEELEDWLDMVLERKSQSTVDLVVSEIEG